MPSGNMIVILKLIVVTSTSNINRSRFQKMFYFPPAEHHGKYFSEPHAPWSGMSGIANATFVSRTLGIQIIFGGKPGNRTLDKLMPDCHSKTGVRPLTRIFHYKAEAGAVSPYGSGVSRVPMLLFTDD